MLITLIGHRACKSKYFIGDYQIFNKNTYVCIKTLRFMILGHF